jgi:hypothetical protein
MLRFYATLACWQREVAESLIDRLATQLAEIAGLRADQDYPLMQFEGLGPAVLGPHLPGFIRVLDQGPAPLVDFASRLRDTASLPDQLVRAGAAAEISLLAEDADLPLEVAEFAGQAMWQPLLELIATRAGIDLGEWYGPVCPFCAGPPLCSSLAGTGPNSGQRLLICKRCLLQWPAPRLRCPECGADDDGAFSPVEAEQYPAMRLDVCARCRCYLKTADGRADGHVIAEVDDIATPALDLWASAQGLHRLAPPLVR